MAIDNGCGRVRVPNKTITPKHGTDENETEKYINENKKHHQTMGFGTQKQKIEIHFLHFLTIVDYIGECHESALKNIELKFGNKKKNANQVREREREKNSKIRREFTSFQSAPWPPSLLTSQQQMKKRNEKEEKTQKQYQTK